MPEKHTWLGKFGKINFKTHVQTYENNAVSCEIHTKK